MGHYLLCTASVDEKTTMCLCIKKHRTAHSMGNFDGGLFLRFIRSYGFIWFSREKRHVCMVGHVIFCLLTSFEVKHMLNDG